MTVSRPPLASGPRRSRPAPGSVAPGNTGPGTPRRADPESGAGPKEGTGTGGTATRGAATGTVPTGTATTRTPLASAARAPGTARRGVPALAALLLSALVFVSGCGAGSGGSDNAAGSHARDGAAAENAPAGAKDGAESAARDADTPGTGDGYSGDKRPAGTNAAPGPAETHVIRTATLRIRTSDVTGTVDRAQQIAADAGGYVGSETTTRLEKERERSRMVLRIPQDRYEESLDDLVKLGKVLERRMSAEDVTDQVVDVESRVKTQRSSVDRVRRLMDRAEKIGDIVALEEELRTRQADLDSLLAQQKSLGDRTGMATVNLTFTEPAAEKKDKGGDDGVGAALADAFGDGWHAFYVAFRGLLVVIAAVLPFAVLLGLLYLLVRRFFPRARGPIAVGPPVPGMTAFPSPAGPAAPASPVAPAAPTGGTDTGKAGPGEGRDSDA